MESITHIFKKWRIKQMTKTPMPIIAGVIDIVSGILDLVGFDT